MAGELSLQGDTQARPSLLEPREFQARVLSQDPAGTAPKRSIHLSCLGNPEELEEEEEPPKCLWEVALPLWSLISKSVRGTSNSSSKEGREGG